MKERVYKFDNIKALLIFLVVFGHVLRPFITNDALINFLYVFIYLFHMPAFIFIMGKFAKPNIKRIKLFVFLYFPFQIIYFLLFEYILIDKTYSPFSFFNPVWILWYLIVAAIYTAATYVLPKETSKAKIIIIIVAAFLLALLVGHIPFIGLEFSLSRLFVFAPFFLIGYYNLLPEKNGMGHAIIWGLISIVLVFYYILSHSICIDELHHKVPYIITNSTLTTRAVAMITAFCIIKFLLSIIPNKQIPVFSDIGQHTLFIFLFHGFIVKFVFKFYTPANPLLFGIVFTVFTVVLLWICDVAYQKLKHSILSKLHKENKQ